MSTVRTFEDVLNDPQPGEPVFRVAEIYPRQGDWSLESYLDFADSYEGRVELVDGRLEFLEPVFASPDPPEPRRGEPVYRVAENYPRQGDWTYEAYCQVEESFGGRVELVNGRLEFLPVPKRVHQDVLMTLLLMLHGFVSARLLGQVRPSGNRLRLPSASVREPDVLFVSREKVEAHNREEDFRDADLVVEIVSPDRESHKRDYEEKREAYAEAGIPEYWIVDPQEKVLVILVLDDGAAEYREAFRGGPGTVGRSVVLAGLEVDVAGLFVGDV